MLSLNYFSMLIYFGDRIPESGDQNESGNPRAAQRFESHPNGRGHKFTMYRNDVRMEKDFGARNGEMP
jgi:hypothetical protein